LTGFGCDEKRVIQILGHRTQPQRMAIADAYQRQYGESIHKRLKSELHGKLEVWLNQRSFLLHKHIWSYSLNWRFSKRQNCDIQVHRVLKTWIGVDLRFQTGVWESANLAKFCHFNEYDVYLGVCASWYSSICMEFAFSIFGIPLILVVSFAESDAFMDDEPGTTGCNFGE